MRAKGLFVCVVVPCLNEEKTLADTCYSLGFGAQHDAIDNAVLILVDNGSTDNTISIAKGLQKSSRPNVVLLAREPERGYVPPRRRGVAIAGELGAKRGISKEGVLIVQADADTNYARGYLNALRRMALSRGPGIIVEARMEWPSALTKAQRQFIELCNEVDAGYDSLLSGNPDDVVVDDKTCAFRLSDYELWGGHQREFTADGDEIFSETTRLYLRAKTHGVTRHLCDEAVASHSMRRIMSEPALSFATAGFPREDAFRSAWDKSYRGPATVADFSDPNLKSTIEFAIRSRHAHLRGLFGELPLHVSRTLSGDRSVGNDLLTPLPRRNQNDLRNYPGILLQDVLVRVDKIVFQA